MHFLDTRNGRPFYAWKRFVRRRSEAAQEGRHDPGRACGRGRLSVFTVRVYEQGKRMPNDEQRLAMARAFGVPEEVLTGYDIRNANEGLTAC